MKEIILYFPVLFALLLILTGVIFFLLNNRGKSLKEVLNSLYIIIFCVFGFSVLYYTKSISVSVCFLVCSSLLLVRLQAD